MCVVGVDFNSFPREESRYSASGVTGAQGDGARGEVVEISLETMLELDRQSWAYRRFMEGVMFGPSRTDRLHISLSPAASP